MALRRHPLALIHQHPQIAIQLSAGLVGFDDRVEVAALGGDAGIEEFILVGLDKFSGADFSVVLRPGDIVIFIDGHAKKHLKIVEFPVENMGDFGDFA